MSNAGRPTSCTQDIADELCRRLAEGESLRAVCASESMPDKSTVLLWVVSGRVIEGTDEEFSDQYMRAREAAGFSHADSVVDIANRCVSTEKNPLEPNAARVAISGLQWAAERMAPKKHSQRQEIDHSSTDRSMTPQPGVDTSKLSDEALQELMRARDSSESE
jgi:hypothetical protein